MQPGLPRIATLTAGQSQCIFCYISNLNKVEVKVKADKVEKICRTGWFTSLINRCYLRYFQDTRNNHLLNIFACVSEIWIPASFLYTAVGYQYQIFQVNNHDGIIDFLFTNTSKHKTRMERAYNVLTRIIISLGQSVR